jgi:Mn-dependent DtxR family transcriptional regulator
MNERIRELIWETDEWLESNAQSDRWEREIKFAQLIVQECCQKLESDGMVEIAMEIKQHFGVEE